MLKLILAALLAPGCRLAWAGDVSVSIKSQGHGDCILEGEFQTETPRTTAWAVLTDYDHLPAFVPSMKLSRVQQRNGDSIYLEQKSVVGSFPFTKTIYVLLNVHETPLHLITFEDTSRRSFALYVGSWDLKDTKDGLLVKYRLEARGLFLAPQFLMKELSRNLVRNLLREVQTEMERRSTGDPRIGQFVAYNNNDKGRSRP
jgi:hypothetical protein